MDKHIERCVYRNAGGMVWVVRTKRECGELGWGHGGELQSKCETKINFLKSESI